MIFLAAMRPCTLEAYGARFSLTPLSYPEIDISQILVMEAELGRRILQRDNKRVKRISFDAHKLPGFPQPLPLNSPVPPGSGVMIIRGGGIGDVIMALPAIRHLRHHLGDQVQLSLATFEQNVPLLAAAPEIDQVMAEPLTLGQLMSVDYFFEFQDPDHLMGRMHMIDFYLMSLGVMPENVEDKLPFLNVGKLLIPEIAKYVSDAGAGYARTVYFNGKASDRLRDLPPELINEFMNRFPDVLFVIPAAYFLRMGAAKKTISRYPNMLQIDTKNSLESYVTALHTCDAVITADTSAYHIAAAIGKPALALFGPIDPKLRTGYYPSVTSVSAVYSGKTCQAPCGKSMVSEFSRKNGRVATRCPEARLKGSQFSPCLTSFLPDRLMKAFSNVLKSANRL